MRRDGRARRRRARARRASSASTGRRCCASAPTILGIAPAGTISAGRDVPAAAGGRRRWVAMNLARRADVELLAAWMGREWARRAVGRGGRARSPTSTAEPRWNARSSSASRRRWRCRARRADTGARSLPGRGRAATGPHRRASTCSALWAGPLCARLLGATAARRCRRSSSSADPTARARGHPEFWRRLNGAQGGASPSSRDAPAAALLERRRRRRDARRGRGRSSSSVSTSRAACATTAWSGSRSRVTASTASGATASRSVTTPRSRVGSRSQRAGDAPVFVGDAPADPLAGLHAAGRGPRSCVRRAARWRHRRRVDA